MALIAWNDSLSVGVPSIDAQHRQLLALLNELYDATQKGQGEDVVHRTLQGMRDYALSHFKYEEELFAQTHYPHAAAHAQEHQRLTAQLDALCQRDKLEGRDSISDETLRLIVKWFLDHTLGSDQKYAAHLCAAGII